MDLILGMNNAVSYIEDNLDDEIDYVKAARLASCSAYDFHRIFSFITGVSISEYIRRRRLTLAAFEFQTTNAKVIDVALKYGYDSPESFTRAFQTVHGVTPSVLRDRGVIVKAYPRISFQFTIKGESEMNYKITDKPAFQFYGIERIFDTKDGENLTAIPEFWTELEKDGKLMEICKSTGYETICNAVCGYRDVGMTLTTFPYLIGCIRTPISETDGYTIVDVPAATWAIFANEPHSRDVMSAETQKLISRVYTDWLPTANFNMIPGYDIEMYHILPDGRWYEETWIRVEPK